MSGGGYVYHQGPGELKIALRNPLTAVLFTEEKRLVRLRDSRDVTDLLSPQIGGGRFARGEPLADAAMRFGVTASAIEGIQDVLILDYRGRETPAEAPPERILVLTTDTRKAIEGLKSERVEAPADTLKSERVEQPEASVAMVEDPAETATMVHPPAQKKPKKGGK